MKSMVVLRLACSILILSMLTVKPAEACTAFRLVQDRHVLVGRNLDWDIEEGYFIIQPRGIHRRALVPNSQPVAEWDAEWGSVTACQFGRDFPLGGMNEAGLAVVELSLSISRYPRPDHRPVINEFQWIQYMLDTCASTTDVIHAAEDLRIEPALFALHYFVVDRTGQAAVIQFLDGRMIVRTGKDLPVPVLTNNSYDNMIRYLKHHKGFGGTRIPGPGTESPERFARTATLTESEPEGEVGILDRALHIQDAAAQSDTVWKLIYDPVSLCIHVRTATQPELRSLQFNRTWFHNGRPARMLNLNAPPSMWSDRSIPSTWTLPANRAWIQLVFDKLGKRLDGHIPNGINVEVWSRHPLESRNRQ